MASVVAVVAALTTGPISGGGTASALQPGQTVRVTTSADLVQEWFRSATGRNVTYHGLDNAGGGFDLVWRDLVTNSRRVILDNHPGAVEGISPEGRFVSLSSIEDLTAETGSAQSDAYVWDSATNTFRLVSTASVSSDASQFFTSGGPLSADARQAVFVSNVGVFTPHQDTVLPGQCPGGSGVCHLPQVYVRDLTTGAFTLVSVNRTNTATGNGAAAPIAITPDGRFVLFSSNASDLTSAGNGGMAQLYVRDLVARTTTLVTVGPTGAPRGIPFEDIDDPFPPQRTPPWSAAISEDGRYVAFSTPAAMVSGDTNGQPDVYVRDLQTRTTSLMSGPLAGGQGNGAATTAEISADGRFVSFASTSTNLVTGDTNGIADTFVRDRVLNTMTRPAVGFVGSLSTDARYFWYAVPRGTTTSGPPFLDLWVKDVRPVRAVSVGDVTVEEGDTGANSTASFTLTLTRSHTAPVTVQYQTFTGSGGTATSGTDFVAVSGTATFPPGVTHVIVGVPIRPDGGVEPTEMFSLLLSAPSAGTGIFDHWGKAFILDNDPPTAAHVSIGDVTVLEGDAGTRASFTVTLSRALTTTATVRFATVPGTASTSDFSSRTGTLTFPAGTTSLQIPVVVTGGTALEHDETMTVRLSSPTGVALGRATGTLTIRDDD